MFSRLIANTFVSAAAFVVTSVINLLLIPFIIRKYGLTEYGLITIARILLPSGAMAVFDFGYSELATLAVARAREDRDWSAANQQLTALLAVSTVVALMVGLTLGLGATAWTSLFHTPPALAGSFRIVVIITAASVVPLLTGLVVDGAVKGFEAFRAIRAIEIGCTMLYATATVAFMLLSFSYAAVALVYVGSLVLRVLLLLLVLRRYAGASTLRIERPSSETWKDVRRRNWLMAGSKLLGAAQTQAAPLVIGGILGPASVGIYDILVRLPRFAKSIFALLNSAVLPVASRLDASNQPDAMRRLGEVGTLGVALATIPAAIAGMTFSYALLASWIGARFAGFWGWQAIMFLIPLLNSLVSFGQTALLGRAEVVARLNKIVSLQIILQFAVALATLKVLDERAFILGQVIATVATFPFQMRVIAEQKDMSRHAMWRLVVVFAIPAVLGVLTLASGAAFWPVGGARLALSLAGWLSVCYAALWYLALADGERARILTTATDQVTRQVAMEK